MMLKKIRVVIMLPAHGAMGDSLEVRCSNAVFCHLIKTLQASYCANDSLVVSV
jgi:hypothetical protein